jgi:hypothetical protein
MSQDDLMWEAIYRSLLGSRERANDSVTRASSGATVAMTIIMSMMMRMMSFMMRMISFMIVMIRRFPVIVVIAGRSHIIRTIIGSYGIVVSQCRA